MPNPIKGFQTKDGVRKYDYNELENLPENDPDDLALEVEEVKEIIESKNVIKITATGDIASFTDSADDYPVKDLVAHIEPVQSGSGDPSPDNVRPITGWTGANVTRTGKNLLNPDFNAYATTFYYYFIKNVVPKNEVARFTFSDKDTSVDVTGCYIGFVHENLTSVTNPINYNWAINNGNITTNPINRASLDSNILCENVFVYPNTPETFNKIFSRYNVMVELGSTATSYEPHNGDTYAVTFPTEAGTVYGGTLDVTTGVLTVDTVSTTISSGRVGGVITQLTNTTRFILLDALVPEWHNRFIICDRLKRNDYGTDAVGFSHGDYSANVFIKLDKSLGLTNQALINEWLSNNPLQFVYKLATPTTYQLTPIEVKTLLGANNIFADTGAVDVEYCADTKKYIDNAIASAIASLS